MQERCDCLLCVESRRFSELFLKLSEEDRLFLETFYDFHIEQSEELSITQHYLSNLKKLYPKIYKEIATLKTLEWENQNYPEKNI